jgi:hypothetical protein
VTWTAAARHHVRFSEQKCEKLLAKISAKIPIKYLEFILGNITFDAV